MSQSSMHTPVIGGVANNSTARSSALRIGPGILMMRYSFSSPAMRVSGSLETP